MRWFPQQQALAWLHCEEAPAGKSRGKEGRRWLFQDLPFSEMVAVNTQEPWVPGEGEPLGTSAPPWEEKARERPVGISELIVYTWKMAAFWGGGVRKRTRQPFHLMKLGGGDQAPTALI